MVGPGAGGAGLGAGMQALGFLGHLVQMPGTRGVLIPCVCVCVCCPTLPDVGAFCCVDPPGGPLLPCGWDRGCPWTG